MSAIDMKIELGDIDGDGKQDVKITTDNGRSVVVSNVKDAALHIVEIIAAVLTALGLNGLIGL